MNAKGEPRVSPLDSLFIHGRFTLSTGGAAKLKRLRRNPGLLGGPCRRGSHCRCGQRHRGVDRPRPPDHDEIHRAWSNTYESDPYGWGGDIVFFRIQPKSMWAYAFHPEEFPG